MLKRIAGVIAGIIVAGLAVFAIEWIGHRLFPTAGGETGEVSSMPVGTLAMVVAAWFLGTLLGGTVAARIAERGWAAWAVAAFILLGVVMNVVSRPHPLWMTIAGVALPLIAGWLASRSRRTRSGREGAAAV